MAYFLSYAVKVMDGGADGSELTLYQDAETVWHGLGSKTMDSAETTWEDTLTRIDGTRETFTRTCHVEIDLTVGTCRLTFTDGTDLLFNVGTTLPVRSEHFVFYVWDCERASQSSYELTPLATPSIVSAIATGSSSMNVEYSQVENAEFYSLDYNTTGNFSDAGSGSALTISSSGLGTFTTAVTGLSAETTYYFRIQALPGASDVYEPSEWSEVVSATTASESGNEEEGESRVDIHYKSYVDLERAPVNPTHAATKAYVDNHAANGASHVPTQNASGYVFESSPSATTSGSWTAYSTSVTSDSAALVTSGGVYTAIAALSSVYAPIAHNHAATAITSGTLAAARLPAATTSALGAIKVGTGLAIASGVLSVGDLSATYSVVAHTHTASDVSAIATSALVTSVTSTSTDATVPSAKAVYSFVNANYAAKTHTHTASQVTGLGTAATLNTGTASGNIPLLDANGKLVKSVIPAVAITNTFTAASQTAMLALSSAEEGDVAVRTDLRKTFILTSSEANSYATLANWQELLTPTDAVTSVNGQTGSVTLTATDVSAIAASALVTSVSSTSTDATVPSAKGVYTFVNTNYAAKNHSHSATEITEGTLAAARLPVASSSTLGAIKVGNGLSITAGYLAVTVAYSTTYSATNDTLPVTMKAVAAYTSDACARASHTHSELAGPVAVFHVPFDYETEETYLGVQDMIASVYSATATYAVGDYVTNEGLLYRCVTAIATAEAFNGTKWTPVTVMESIGQVAHSTGRFDGTITGDNSTTAFVLNHNLGTRNVFVEIIDSEYNKVLCAIQKTSVNSVTIYFAEAPTATETYNVAIRS